MKAEGLNPDLISTPNAVAPPSEDKQESESESDDD